MQEFRLSFQRQDYEVSERGVVGNTVARPGSRTITERKIIPIGRFLRVSFNRGESPIILRSNSQCRSFPLYNCPPGFNENLRTRIHHLTQLSMLLNNPPLNLPIILRSSYNRVIIKDTTAGKIFSQTKSSLPTLRSDKRLLPTLLCW